MTNLEPIREVDPSSERRLRRVTPDEVPLSDREELVLDLVHVGISLRKAEHLVSRYSADRIRRQLGWLTKRAPRKPASMLIAAIENDYDAPAYTDVEPNRR